MGLSPTDVGALSLFEYGALLHHWNLQHTPEDERPVAPPDVDEMLAEFAVIEASGLAVMVH